MIKNNGHPLLILRWIASTATIASFLAVNAGCTDGTPSFGSPATGGMPTGGMPTGGMPTGGMPTGGMLTGGVVANPAQPDSGMPGQAKADPWCEALAVFQSACQSCHGSELAAGAPMALLDYANTQAPSSSAPDMPVHALIDARIHDVARPMPPLDQTALTPVQLASLDSWLAAGAPDSAMKCAEAKPDPAAPTEPEWPEDCEEWYEIRASDDGQPHIVPADTEQALDFNIPVPWANSGSGPVQALAIRPIAGNKRVVHHWILYAGTRDFITSWSPGKPMEVFPEGVGVHMPNSGTFRLDMHYYNVGNDMDEPDNSGLEVCITRKLRKNTATTFMFSGSANAPANSKVTNVRDCTVRAAETVHLITSSPHMHSYGVHAKLEIERDDGSVEVLEDGPFNWESQHITNIEAKLETGDKVRITCVYENNTAQNIRFGSGSEDEMCFNFARYYPMDALECPGSFF